MKEGNKMGIIFAGLCGHTFYWLSNTQSIELISSHSAAMKRDQIMVLCHKNIPKQHHSHYGEKYISHVYHQLVDLLKAPFRAAGFPPLLFQLQKPRLLSSQLCAGRTDAGL